MEKLARLGQLERAVMEALWDKSPSSRDASLTAREVAETLPNHAYTTVLTVLDRLTKKGLVLRIRDGKAHHYRPTSSRDAYIADLMHEALNGTSDRNAALIRFAQTVSVDQARLLRDILHRFESPVRRGKKS